MTYFQGHIFKQNSIFCYLEWIWFILGQKQIAILSNSNMTLTFEWHSLSLVITRNVSIGHGCPHLCNCGRTDRRTDKGKSKCPLKWGHKNVQHS